MFENFIRLRSTRRLVWLFCLALLLPIAQLSATWHTLSHSFVQPISMSFLQSVQTPQNERGKGETPAQNHCDLCVVAANVSVGVLLATPHVLPLLHARYDTPDSPRSHVRVAGIIHVYQSRAPPTTSL